MMRRLLAFLLAFAAAPALAQSPANPPYSTAGGAAAQPSVPMAWSAACGCFAPVGAANPLAVNASVAASIAPFQPTATVGLSVTTASARIAFGDGNAAALVQNPGTADAFIALGNGTVTATTATMRVPAGGAVGIDTGGNADLAAITASGSTTLTITTGLGLPVVAIPGAGGGGGGSNASVSGTGAAVPGSGTYIAGTNSGTLQGIAVNASGQVAVQAPPSLPALPNNQSVNVAQLGGSTVATGGASGSVGVGGLAASGASVAGNPLLDGGRAESAEPGAMANGQAVAAAYDLAGKTITSPYANRENYLRGASSATASSATTLTGMGAQGSGVKIYITSLQCGNTSATTITVALNDTAASTFICPAGYGSNVAFPTPLAIAANTAAQFTPSAAASTIYVNAQGYAGY